MAERKQYPNISDEELDRRAEEALRRMLDKSQGKPQAPAQNTSHNPPRPNQNRNRRKHRGRR